MASYHLHAQIVKRSEGRSVVAMAAYRAGARLNDDRNQRTADYSRRRGMVHAEIMAPDGAAEWLTDREKLWNGVERSEKRRDAQLAREINIALPQEMTPAERLELVRSFVGEQFVARGMVADFAIHEPVEARGDDPRNHHAHIMLTLRQATGAGLRKVKTREWNSDAMLDEWHEAWCGLQNRALERGGYPDRVDYRRLKTRAAEARAAGDEAAAAVLDREPEIHIGPRARQAAARKRPPHSQVREAGPRRVREPDGRRRKDRPQGARPERRKVRYPEFDQGSRVSFNEELIDRNWRRTRDRLEHREKQAFRLRERQIRAQRRLTEADRQLAAMAQRVPGMSSWGRQESPSAAMTAQHMAWERERARAMRHAVLVRKLLADVSGIMARLMGTQLNHQARRRGLLPSQRSPARTRGQPVERK